MKLIVAGYTAAPADAAQQASYYERLYALRAADGLGFAWSGTGTPALLAPVVAAMPAHWSLTLNDIPATWKACAANGMPPCAIWWPPATSTPPCGSASRTSST